MIDKSKIYTEFEDRIGEKYAKIFFDFAVDKKILHELVDYIDKKELNDALSKEKK